MKTTVFLMALSALAGTQGGVPASNLRTSNGFSWPESTLADEDGPKAAKRIKKNSPTGDSGASAAHMLARLALATAQTAAMVAMSADSASTNSTEEPILTLAKHRAQAAERNLRTYNYLATNGSQELFDEYIRPENIDFTIIPRFPGTADETLKEKILRVHVNGSAGAGTHLIRFDLDIIAPTDELLTTSINITGLTPNAAYTISLVKKDFYYRGMDFTGVTSSPSDAISVERGAVNIKDFVASSDGAYQAYWENDANLEISGSDSILDTQKIVLWSNSPKFEWAIDYMSQSRDFYFQLAKTYFEPQYGWTLEICLNITNN